METLPLLQKQKQIVQGLTRQLFLQSLPLIVRYLLYACTNLLQLYMAPLFSSADSPQQVLIASIALSNMFANVSCLSILVGMASVIETLGSQYNGAKQYRQVGLSLQRAVLILSIIATALVPVWYYSAPIFKLMGIESAQCEIVSVFLRIRILGLPADILRESYEAYLMSLGIMVPPMMGSFGLNAALLVFNLFFAKVLGWHGYECLAWSFVLANYVGFATQVAVSWHLPLVQLTLQPLDWEALQGWREFIDLGTPAVLQLCSEWWAYEALTVFAAQLGTASLDAEAFIFQLIIVCFMFPLGIQMTLTTLVGTALGEGDAELAQAITWHALGTAFALELCVGIVCFTCGGYLLSLLTTDPEILEIIMLSVPYLSLYTVVDGMQGTAAGVLKGAGKQSIGAKLNLTAFYVIGLPLAWTFCFKLQLGVRGLLVGMSFGTIFQITTVMYLLIFRAKEIFVPYIDIGDSPL